MLALSFLPQFASPGYPVLPTLVGLSVVWALVDAVWFLLVIWFIDKAKASFTRAKTLRRVTGLSGAVLIGLGLRLALESQ